MDTKFNNSDSRTKYCAYIDNLRLKYIRTLKVTAMIESILIVISFILHKSIILFVLLPLQILSLIYILYKVSELDGIISKGYIDNLADIRVGKVSKGSVNGEYSTKYLKSLGINLEVGKKYRAVYLTGHSKIIVDIKEIKEEH